MVTRSWSANELFILYSISVLLPKHGIPKLACGGNVLFVGLTSGSQTLQQQFLHCQHVVSKYMRIPYIIINYTRVKCLV